MYIKLVKSLLASTILLIGMGGTAMGESCDNVLERMQDTIENMDEGTAAVGTIPVSLRGLPYNSDISVHESEMKNGNGEHPCFILKGQWSQNPNKLVELLEAGQEKFPPIKAYVFYKNKNIKTIKNNLRVDSSLPNEDGNRHIALTTRSKEDYYDIVAGGSDIQNIKGNVIWLDRNAEKLKYVEVVLCEGPCRDILGVSSIDTTNYVPMDPDGEAVIGSLAGSDQDGTRDRVTSACNEPKTSDKDQNEIREQIRKEIEPELRTKITEDLQSEFKPKEREIRKDAIDTYSTSKTIFEFKDEHNRKLGGKKLIPKGCKPQSIGGKLTQSYISTFFYENCVSIPGYTISKVTKILHSKPPTIKFKLKKNKPETISEIKVPVKMLDGSIITNACTLQAQIVDTESGEVVFEETFPSTGSNPKKHSFSMSLNKSIIWKGKTLVLTKADIEGERGDCKPKDNVQSIPLLPKLITNNGVLKIREIVLDSTLGNALLVLNTMIGEPRSDASASTTELYPIADDETSRNLFTEMVTESLQQLSGKVKGLKVGLYNINGELDFTDYSDKFKKMHARKLAKEIVDEVKFVKGDFVWDTMINAVNRGVANQNDYTYMIFIGQSGMSNNKSYCKNPPRKRTFDEEGVDTFIYDFAANANTDNPPEVKVTDDRLRVFPAKLCDNNPRHIVFFPKAKKSGGWKETVRSLLSDAFQDR